MAAILCGIFGRESPRDVDDVVIRHILLRRLSVSRRRHSCFRNRTNRLKVKQFRQTCIQHSFTICAWIGRLEQCQSSTSCSAFRRRRQARPRNIIIILFESGNMARKQTHKGIQTDRISKKCTIKHSNSHKNADGLAHRLQNGGLFTFISEFALGPTYDSWNMKYDFYWLCNGFTV